MKDYTCFLNESKQIDLEQIKAYIESLGFPLYDTIKNKTEGYIQEGKRKITLTVYSADRLSAKDNIQDILKSNRINYQEVKKSESSIKATVLGKGNDEIAILYKPLKGSGGSGAGSAQTALQETTQAIFLSLSFNVLKRKLTSDDIFKENLNNAYQYVDTNDFPIMEILAFSEDEKWLNTFIETANMIFADYYDSNKSYTFERGSELIKKLYDDFKEKSKEMNIKAQGDKWNPSDIWMISNTLNELPSIDTLSDLNSFVYDKFLSKDLIGISLKKLSSKPKVTVLNLGQSDTRKKYKSYVISPTSKDVYLYATDGSKIQFRSFNALGSYQGEIIGKSAKHGKIGYSMITYFLSKYTNSMLPQYQAEIKDRIIDNDKTLYIEFANLWNKFIKDRQFANEKDVLDYASKSKAPEDFIYSKYLSLKIVDTINNMTDEHKNSLMSDIFGFASSSSDFSSVFVKVS